MSANVELPKLDAVHPVWGGLYNERQLREFADAQVARWRDLLQVSRGQYDAAARLVSSISDERDALRAELDALRVSADGLRDALFNAPHRTHEMALKIAEYDKAVRS